MKHDRRSDTLRSSLLNGDGVEAGGGGGGLTADSVLGVVGSEGGAGFFSVDFGSSFLGGSGSFDSCGDGCSCFSFFSLSDDSLGSLGVDFGSADSLSPKAKNVRCQSNKGNLQMMCPRYRFRKASDQLRHYLLPTQTIE